MQKLVKSTVREAVHVVLNAAKETPREMFSPWVAFAKAAIALTKDQGDDNEQMNTLKSARHVHIAKHVVAKRPELGDSRRQAYRNSRVR